MATLLQRYLADSGQSQTDFAARVGISQSLISRYVAGTRRPGLDTAHKIERATDGAVPATSWLEEPGSSASSPPDSDSAEHPTK